MNSRKAGTAEQAWCGRWYDCAKPTCASSVLLPSRELRAYLGAARKGK